MTNAASRMVLTDFTIEFWIEVPAHFAGWAGGIADQWDPIARREFSVSAISSAGGYSGPGDELRISFGIDSGTEPRWTSCGRPSPVSNYVSNSLTVFDGSLFAATSDAPDARDRGHVYRFLGDEAWEDCGQVAADGASGIGPMVVHRGALFAASWNYDWTRVHDQPLKFCHVHRFVETGMWEDCGQPGASRRIFGLGSFRGDLYAAGDDFTVHVYRGEGDWEQVASLPTYGHPLTTGEQLYVGTLDPAAVWTFDGAAWANLGNPLGSPERCTQVHSLAWFRGALHAGTWPLGRVARLEAESGRWTDIGRMGDSSEINALVVYNGKLYGGSIPRAEVFRCDGDRAWTRIRRFFDPPGWRPVLVRNMERPPDGDSRMREWSRVTSLTEHDGQLFASVGSCTSAAIDAPADIRGTVHAMSAGTVATAPQSLEVGWHHVAAVRAARRVSVYVDGSPAASTVGEVDGDLNPAARLRIGESEAGPYRGAIRGFSWWDRALGEREIGALAAGRPPIG